MSKNLKKLIQIIIATILTIMVLIIDKFTNLNEIVILLLYIGCYLFIAFKVLLKAIKNIIHGQIFDENFLMTIASIGALILGEYLEGIAVILIWQVGDLFESYAVKKSRNDITNLMNIKPNTATKIENNQEIILDPMLIEIGDILIVKVGEKVPLDGVITSGNTQLDTSSLTGESLPVEKGIGDEILSGSINIGKVIYMKVTKAYADSTVAKILDLVENATNRKTKTEKFITKFAKYYTPIVVTLALLLAIIPSLITKEWSVWINRALSFLVVSCPCALVISVPLSFFSGIGASSKKGILIKGSNYLELINKANIFVFDKTGTLTKGNFVVQEIHHEVELNQFLEAALSAEIESNHPLAKSIIKYISNYQAIKPLKYEIEEVAGYGIIARKNDEIILAGNDKLLDKYQISYEKCSQIGTTIYIAKNNQYYGYFLIKDEIKEEAKRVISELNKMDHSQTVMLTGDKEEVARDVSQTLNLSSYQANLLPDGKVQALEKMIKAKKAQDVIAYLGDGINDAPVLMMADIGIAMGGIGSDSAIEASDIVLMHDKLENLLDLRKIAKKTMLIVKENIIFAISIKIIVLILSALGISNIWLAIFADVGVCIIAILNAMRAMKIK